MKRIIRRLLLFLAATPALFVVLLEVWPANYRGFIARFDYGDDNIVVQRDTGMLVIRPRCGGWTEIWFSTLFEIAIIAPSLIWAAFSRATASNRADRVLTFVCAIWLIVSGILFTFYMRTTSFLFHPPLQIAVCIFIIAFRRRIVQWARFLFRSRSTRRLSHGLCPGCAYDIRATPQGGGALLDRCPECGMIVPRQVTG